MLAMKGSWKRDLSQIMMFLRNIATRSMSTALSESRSRASIPSLAILTASLWLKVPGAGSASAGGFTLVMVAGFLACWISQTGCKVQREMHRCVQEVLEMSVRCCRYLRKLREEL